jgi:hypothetical protein
MESSSSSTDVAYSQIISDQPPQNLSDTIRFPKAEQVFTRVSALVHKDGGHMADSSRKIL